MKLKGNHFGLLIALLSVPAIRAEALDIPPPALVECKIEATCDRNPEHLKEFVAGFYKWYVAHLEKSDLPPGESREALQKKAGGAG